MKGFFDFSVQAKDLVDHTDTATVKIFIVAEFNRVTFVFINSLSQFTENPLLQPVVSKILIGLLIRTQIHNCFHFDSWQTFSQMPTEMCVILMTLMRAPLREQQMFEHILYQTIMKQLKRPSYKS